MFDGLHHAREHLSLEQTLAILRWLTQGYGTDSRITEPRRHPRDLDRVRGQPRWRRVRPDRIARTAPGARTASRTPARPRSGPTSTATTAITGRAAAARRAMKSADTYHGSAAFSTPEARAIRDFMASRRIGGRPADQDGDHVPHRRRAGPLAVRLHPHRGPVRHDRPTTTPRSSHSGGRWRPRTATRRCSRARCTSPTATRSTGPTATSTSSCTPSRCTHRRALVTSTARFYPPDEVIAPQTERNKERHPPAHRGCGLPVQPHRQGGPELRPAVRRLRDRRRLGHEPERHRHRDERPLATRRPAGDDAPGRDRSVRARRRSSRAGSQARRRIRTTSTAGHDGPVAGRSPCPRRSAR